MPQFDPGGDIAILVVLGTAPSRRRSDRLGLMVRTRGVAVLTYGTVWEIYDLRLRARSFTNKIVEHLVLDWDMPNEPEGVARAPA